MDSFVMESYPYPHRRQHTMLPFVDRVLRQRLGDNILPKDCLIQMMTFLDFNEKLEAAFVSRKWWICSKSPDLFDVLDLSPYFYKMDDKAIEKIFACSKKFSKIKKLILDDCIEITDLAIETISKRCANLETLSLKNCVSVSSNSVGKMLFRCQKIKSIEFDDFSIEIVRALKEIFWAVDFGDIWKFYCAKNAIESNPNLPSTRTGNTETKANCNFNKRREFCWGRITGLPIYGLNRISQNTTHFNIKKVAYVCQNHLRELENEDSLGFVLCRLCSRYVERALMWKEAMCSLCKDAEVIMSPDSWIDLKTKKSFDGFPEIWGKGVTLYNLWLLPKTLQCVASCSIDLESLQLADIFREHSGDMVQMCEPIVVVNLGMKLAEKKSYNRAILVKDDKNSISLYSDMQFLENRNNKEMLDDFTFYLKNFWSVLLPIFFAVLMTILKTELYQSFAPPPSSEIAFSAKNVIFYILAQLLFTGFVVYLAITRPNIIETMLKVANFFCMFLSVYIETFFFLLNVSERLGADTNILLLKHVCFNAAFFLAVYSFVPPLRETCIINHFSVVYCVSTTWILNQVSPFTSVFIVAVFPIVELIMALILKLRCSFFIRDTTFQSRFPFYFVAANKKFILASRIVLFSAMLILSRHSFLLNAFSLFSIFFGCFAPLVAPLFCAGEVSPSIVAAASFALLCYVRPSFGNYGTQRALYL